MVGAGIGCRCHIIQRRAGGHFDLNQFRGCVRLPARAKPQASLPPRPANSAGNVSSQLLFSIDASMVIRSVHDLVCRWVPGVGMSCG
jgi:hypothetical protein